MIMWRKGSLIVGAVAVACGASSLARAGDNPPRQLKPGGDVLSTPRAPTQVQPLRIDHVRLEPAPHAETSPSAILKFDLLNDGLDRMTDVLLEVSILEQSPPGQPLGPRRVLVGPFNIRGTAVLQPGYSINYEMLLRNFSSECNCVPNVVVTSARAVPH
jgi:hypothetical protein